jgi:subtilisin family serine protease
MQFPGKQIRLIVALGAASILWGGTEYPAKPGDQVVANQLLVRYLPGTTISSINATLVAGAQIQAVSASLPGVFLVTLPAGTDPSFSTQLSQHVLVDYVEPNRIRQLTISAPNDPNYGTTGQYALTNIHALQAWQLLPNVYLTSSFPELGRIRVAVLDSGADCTHPDFMNAGASSADAAHGGQISFTSSKAIQPTTIVNFTCTWQDDNGHGTHVSGTIAAATNNSLGVASLGYPLELIEFKTQKANGSGTDSDLASAILQAVTAGANVISMSLGGPDYDQTLQLAINVAWQHNVVVVAAAGNNTGSTPSYPGANNHVLGVAATDINDARAGFSNFGPPVGISAPGDTILSTTPGSYGLMSGTSMATPHVAALAGLIEMTTPNLSALSVVQRIQRSADKPANSTAPNGGWDQDFGYGRINAFGGVSGTLRSASVGSIIGQVVNSSGTPLANVTVAVPGQSVPTDGTPTGLYRLSNLPAGPYTVTASGSLPTVTLKATVVAGADTNLTIVMGSASGEFHGIVTDAGTPVSGAVVQAISGGLVLNSAVTDSTGAYSVVVVPPGTYDLHASAVGCINSTTASQNVAGGGSTAANISMPCMGRIAGRLVDANNNPVSGAQISVTSGTYTGGAVTDANGNYSTIALPAGTYTVSSSSGILTTPANNVVVANDQVVMVPAAVTVSTSPSGLSIVVDNVSFTAPHSFAWAPNSSHTIAVSSPQNASGTARLIWSNWSDGQAISHLVTVPNSGSATYTANFTQQYFLTMSAGPGGTVSPASNWFNAGQVVGISATVNGGTAFTGWSGSGSGAFTGSAANASVTMNGAITETASFSSGSAAFVKQDAATQGNWRGVYGNDGYNVIGDQALNPAYVTPAPSGQNAFTWVASTSDARALQKASNPADRIAGAWYTGDSFIVDLPITDANTHLLAVYCLDWDTTTRRETVDILDANGNVLNSQTLTASFHGGVYLVWNVSGHVKVRLTLTGGSNAVLSGLFFGGAGNVVNPPSGSASFVKQDATTQGNWRGIYGTDGYTVIGDTVSNPAYVTPAPAGQSVVVWTPSTSDGRALQKASNPSDRIAGGWYAGNSFTVDLPITDANTHPLALYCLDWDTTARRETVDILDANGNILSSQSLTGSFNGGVYLIWNVAGHVKVRVTVTGGANPVLSGLFFGASGNPVNPPPGSAAFVKIDAATQGNWQGVYGSDGYNVAGDQLLNPGYVTPAAAGQNPFTWIPSTSDARALQKASNPSDRVAAGWYTGSSFTVDLPITDANTHQLAVYCLDWDTTSRRETVDILDASGNVLSSQSLTGSFNSGVYLVWNVSGHVKVRVTLTGGANAVTSGLFFGAAGSGNPASSSASFLQLDTTTRGNWHGAYGLDGYNVLSDLSSNPGYVTPAPAGQNPFTWAGSTTDVRALQKPSNLSDRVAGGWYTGSSFIVDLPITDANTHQLAVYCLDWDTTARRETVDILDANGNVLNSQSLLSSFNGGVYLVWNVAGHVKIRVSLTGGANAVISGLFFR